MRGNYVLRPKWRNQINIDIFKFEDKKRNRDCSPYMMIEAMGLVRSPRGLKLIRKKG